nr:hypothetical protein [uncultured Aminipila sp.]
MNIYENLIEATGAKKVKFNCSGVLEKYKEILKDIQRNVEYSYNSLIGIEARLHQEGYSAAYAQEYLQKERENIDKTFSNMFANKVKLAQEELDSLKKRL